MESDQERQPLLGDARVKNINTEPRVAVGGDKEKNADSQMILRSAIIFLFVVGTEIGSITQSQYIYRWVQKNYNNNQTYLGKEPQNYSKVGQCGENISANSEKYQQKVATDWTWYFSLTEHGVAVLSVTVFGVYSDYIGRKPLLAVSVMGYFLRYGVASFIVFRELHLVYFFVAYSVGGISGANYTFYIGNMASVADQTDRNKHRSLGLAIIETILGLGASFAHLGTGYLIHYTGFFYSNVATAGLFLITLVILLCFLNDTISHVSTKSLTFTTGIKRLFGFYYDKTQIANGKSWKFHIAITVFFLFYFLRGSKGNVETLYFMRSPFCWDAVIIGWYGFVSDIGMFLIALLLMRMLQIYTGDEVISLLGILSCIAFAVIEGLASTSWMLYVAAGTGILSILPFPILRSICSSLVSKNLQGAIFTNLFVVENLCSLGYSTFSSNIYAATQSLMPGLVFLVIAGMLLIPVVLSLLMITCDGTKNPSQTLQTKSGDT